MKLLSDGACVAKLRKLALAVIVGVGGSVVAPAALPVAVGSAFHLIAPAAAEGGCPSSFMPAGVMGNGMIVCEGFGDWAGFTILI